MVVTISVLIHLDTNWSVGRNQYIVAIIKIIHLIIKKESLKEK